MDQVRDTKKQQLETVQKLHREYQVIINTLRAENEAIALSVRSFFPTSVVPFLHLFFF